MNLSVFPNPYGDDLNSVLDYFDLYFSRFMKAVLGQRENILSVASVLLA